MKLFIKKGLLVIYLLSLVCVPSIAQEPYFNLLNFSNRQTSDSFTFSNLDWELSESLDAGLPATSLFFVKKAKSPKIAGLCSLIPGGGQLYNGKYWKVPVVYAVMGVVGGFTYNYHKEYIYYRDEYRLRLNGATEGLNPDLASMTTENVYAYESYYRRNQELGLFVFILCYGLNIVDAIVDAHFSTFNISDDLTMQLQPRVWDCAALGVHREKAMGVGLVFQLK